uniref:Heme-binding protein 2 n=1 Tax=Araucaria cunninghamii TaxID=56994 RepID=A0A0D6QVY1_ARACU
MKLNLAAALYIISLLFIQASSSARVIWSDEKPRPKEVAPSCNSIECPVYEVIDQGKEYEIRRYNNTVWMSTSPIQNISFVAATRNGFLRLFEYIQGKNEKHAEIPMTAPVLTDIFPSRGPFCESSFVVSFYVPESFQESPPKAEEGLGLAETRWDVRYAAVRRFGGFVTDFNIGEEAAKLQASLLGTPWEKAISKTKQGKKGKGDEDPSVYSVAQYNAPFEYEGRVNEIWMLFDLHNSSQTYFPP